MSNSDPTPGVLVSVAVASRAPAIARLRPSCCTFPDTPPPGDQPCPRAEDISRPGGSRHGAGGGGDCCCLRRPTDTWARAAGGDAL